MAVREVLNYPSVTEVLVVDLDPAVTHWRPAAFFVRLNGGLRHAAVKTKAFPTSQGPELEVINTQNLDKPPFTDKRLRQGLFA